MFYVSTAFSKRCPELTTHSVCCCLLMLARKSWLFGVKLASVVMYTSLDRLDYQHKGSVVNSSMACQIKHVVTLSKKAC